MSNSIPFLLVCPNLLLIPIYHRRFAYGTCALYALCVICNGAWELSKCLYIASHRASVSVHVVKRVCVEGNLPWLMHISGDTCLPLKTKCLASTLEESHSPYAMVHVVLLTLLLLELHLRTQFSSIFSMRLSCVSLCGVGLPPALLES